ncbi:hypothetical protein EV356DRAFT_26219 [Viridothelium virens]|uniref:Uncharacterized protein n=1 Tax=Viridothelium virens TaxID=1048519 RepID=A0A6A6HH22_VIRVR|nr:hypothetical protein EV356DRAFT_26219 [Viridothelium virens]
MQNFEPTKLHPSPLEPGPVTSACQSPRHLPTAREKGCGSARLRTCRRASALDEGQPDGAILAEPERCRGSARAHAKAWYLAPEVIVDVTPACPAPTAADEVPRQYTNTSVQMYGK